MKEQKKITETLELLADGFLPFLNQKEEEFLERIAGLQEEKKQKVLVFKDWDWFQGVGLYGYFANYIFSGKQKYYDVLIEYYETQMKKGLPPKNINSVCPMLTLASLYEQEHRPQWLSCIEEWADWLMTELPKTEEGGFQHVTAESTNEGQLWDDTLFVAALFLAKAGKLTGKKEYLEAAKYQFLLHEHYLADGNTGLWYHGFTFQGRHNYGKVFWARGNCWITMAIPELLELLEEGDCVGEYLIRAYRLQVQSLVDLQSKCGLWHTVLDDGASYLEASGSAGIAAGILHGIKLGILESGYLENGLRPLEKLISLTDSNGFLHQVSIGTPLGNSRDFYRQIPLAPMAYGQALGMVYLTRAGEALKEFS